MSAMVAGQTFTWGRAAFTSVTLAKLVSIQTTTSQGARHLSWSAGVTFWYWAKPGR